MSINFEDPMNEAAKSMMEELFKDRIQAMDERTALLDKMELQQKAMSELATVAKQPVTAEIHPVGDIKTMSDGTKYEVTADGWRKLDPTEIFSMAEMG